MKTQLKNKSMQFEVKLVDVKTVVKNEILINITENAIGIVIKTGKTLLHNHDYIKVKFVKNQYGESYTYTEKYYEGEKVNILNRIQ